MPRTKRSAKLDSRTARLRLDAGARHYETVARGCSLLYRRPANGQAGTWAAYWTDFATGKRPMKRLGAADDYQEADGAAVLNYAQAMAAAAAVFDALNRQAKGGVGRGGGAFTVAMALDAYFADGARRGMKGLAKAQQSARAWVLPALGGLPVDGLTRPQLEAWQQAMGDAPRRVRGRMGRPAFAAPPDTPDARRARKATANRVLTVLKAALTFAVDRRLCLAPDAPWKLVKPYRGTGAARVRFLDPGEQARLISACAPPDFRDLVRGALATGMRFGELAGLRCSDYSPAADTPTLYLADSKGGKPRHVYLTAAGAAFVAGLVAGRGAADQPIFATGGGRPWKAGDYGRPLAAACAAAGLEPVTFHELRHSYATALLTNGCPLPVIAAQLGHGDTRQVEKHYGHLAPSYVGQTIRATMPRLDIFGGGKGSAKR